MNAKSVEALSPPAGVVGKFGKRLLVILVRNSRLWRELENKADVQNFKVCIVRKKRDAFGNPTVLFLDQSIMQFVPQWAAICSTVVC
ncbi:hypothetical protein TNCV_3014421 [Trichonephila clavipes]|nr:hypothetical protein TNCV_3014421 [Trichonephila clavipes]